MTWRVAGSLLTLRDQVNRLFPKRDKGADGTIGDLAHQAEPSDHNPDAGGVVRALDLDRDTNDAATPNLNSWLGERLRLGRDRRIRYHINDGRIFYGDAHPNAEGAPPWTWVTYYGDDPHRNHSHTSVVADTSADNPAPWGLSLAAVTDSQEDQELMSAADTIINAVKADNAKTAAGMRTWVMAYCQAKFGGTLARIRDEVVPRLTNIENRLAALEARQPAPPAKSGQ